MSNSANRLVSFVLLFVGMGISGCTTDCASNSPENDSLLQSSAGLTSGCYEKRLTEREQRLAEERTYQNNLENRVQELVQKKEGKSDRRDLLLAQLSALRDQTLELSSEISALKTTTDSGSEKIKELKSQAEDLEVAIIDLKNESEVAESDIEQYERKVARLQEEYSRLERVTRAFGE